MRWRTALTLGRVSNVPTIWTNALTGWLLGGGGAPDGRFALTALALSLSYIGGMYLNDAFDWRIDARERPERPIPAGTVRPATVWGIGAALLAAGLAILVSLGSGFGTWNARPALAGAALLLAILYYDWRHKRDPLSPLWMGLCRALALLIAALVALPDPAGPARQAALMLLCYVVGLTFVAKQETLLRFTNLWPLFFLLAAPVYGALRAGGGGFAWLTVVLLLGWGGWSLHYLFTRRPGDIGRSVAGMIAGISLVDACFIAGAGHDALAAVAIAAFILTLALQRYVPAT
ncbi:MAG: UbiA family prenyltransferase [Proteobacteria bacterium]|nr:UbiA family prenyltransferase [Pseudomonadota bacterium]